MDPPCHHIAVLDLVDVLPSEFVMVAQGEVVEVQTGGCCKNVGLCAELLLSSICYYLYLHCVDVVETDFPICHQHCLEAVIGALLELDAVEVRSVFVVADDSNLDGSEFKELGFGAFGAFKKLALFGDVGCEVEDGIQTCFIYLFVHLGRLALVDGLGVFGSMVFCPIFLTEFGSDFREAQR
jgi:hypothetical protein